MSKGSQKDTAPVNYAHEFLAYIFDDALMCDSQEQQEYC